ncbi:unnamed protein product, partial [Meganyctiphanes norvegica]
GLLELSSGQRPQFTESGKLCVAYNGQQAVCEHSSELIGNGAWGCYIDRKSWSGSKKWEKCTAYAATERRCSSNGVTRHYECDIHDDEGYCCSESGWCGNKKNHCKSPGRNLREEACSGIACGENGECFWDEVQKKADCRCKGNDQYDPSTGQCQECVGNSNCQHDQACLSGTCRRVCDGACATGGQCTSQNHVAKCTCNGELKGNPYSGQDNPGCHQCVLDDDCDSTEHCKEHHCVDPCINYCRINATCAVVSHQAQCYCPKGLTVVGETACESIHPSTNILIYSSSAGALIVLILAIFVTIYCCKLKKKQNSKNGRTDAIEHTYEDPEQMNNMRDMLRESHGHTYENPDILPNIRNITMQPPDGAYVYPDQF